MADDNPDSPPADDAFSLSPDQVGVLREQWVSLGLDPARFDAAAAGEPDPIRPSDDLPVAADALSALNSPTVSAQEAHEAAEYMIRRGMDATAVNAALEADGFAPLAPDERSEDERDFDAAFTPGALAEYKIDFRGRSEGFDEAQIAQANADMTQWLAAVGFPPQIGPAVAEAAMDAGQAYERMDASARELWVREQAALFEGVAGSPEAAEERRAWAEKALARAPGHVTDALRKGGALNDAGVLTNLALQGQRLAARG